MAKKLNVIGLVFLCLAAVGLILAIVGMCTGILSGGNESIGLFHEVWDYIDQANKALSQMGADATIPSRTFTLIAFIVTLIGAVTVLVHGVLSFLGKDIKILGLAAGAVTIIGAILILVAGLMLAGDYDSYAGGKGVISAGIGIWLGAIGGIMAGVAGLLNALKIGQKA